jgi:hypothetical protein
MPKDELTLTENLDALEAGDLAKLQGAFALLAKYCSIKERAVVARKAGRIPEAVMYEQRADKIYKHLPKWARAW